MQRVMAHIGDGALHLYYSHTYMYICYYVYTYKGVCLSVGVLVGALEQR